MKLVITAQTIGKSTLNTVNTVLGKEHIEINQDRGQESLHQSK